MECVWNWCMKTGTCVWGIVEKIASKTDFWQIVYNIADFIGIVLGIAVSVIAIVTFFGSYYSKRIKIVGWANGAHINNGYNFLVTIQNRCLSPLLIKRVSLILDKEVEVVLFQSFTLMDGKDSVEIRTVDPFKTETFVSNGSTLPLLERGSLDKYKHIMFCFTFSDGSEAKIRYKLKPIKEKKYRTLVPKQFVIKDIPVTDHMKYIVEYRNSDGVSSTHIVYRNGRLKEAIGNVDTIPKEHLQSADILKQFLETTIRDSTFEVHTNQHCKQG